MDTLYQISHNQVEWKGNIWPCTVGKNGFAKKKREGDGRTPTGKWRLDTVYYRPDRMAEPNTALPVVAITPDMHWSDCASDPFYNSLVTTKTYMGCYKLWLSSEELWREDNVYDLLITTSHNTNPIVPGHGSAIFIHQMRDTETPTAGCLGLKWADLEFLVATATPETYWDVGEALARITRG